VALKLIEPLFIFNKLLRPVGLTGR